ncbi:MAG: winged helix-turn-helix transcriptional regulator [Tissierellia bacterium]|nr:winged helix-turn-helix transcriptional regulator [Tissierellia bacterium]
MDKKYIIDPNPNWNIEAMGFIVEAMTNKIENIIENHEVFGKTKKEFESFFEPYTLLKERLVEEVLPRYEKYPTLNKIFQMEKKLEKDDLDLGIILILDMEQRYKRPLTNENVDELVGSYMLNRISKVEGLEKESKINSLSDLVQVLEGVEIPDGEKMFYISIYQNRYELVKEIETFTEEVAPILQRNFYLIQDQYNKSIMEFKKLEGLESLLERMVTMKLNMEADKKIIFTVFPFGGINMRHHKENLLVTIGIYIYYFKKWKEEKGFQGAELVSSLKALGDPTRLGIINRISVRPMYIQELADELDLTPATISHHINILLNSQIVNIIVESDTAKKIYYEVNKDKLREIGKTIEHLGDENLRGLDFSGKTAKISIS